MGCSKFLKEKNKNIKIIGVEPYSSPLISLNKKGPHKIQGIGAGFKPDILDLSVIDEILTVTDEESYEYAREVAKTEGLLVGISSGAAIGAALKVAKLPENEGKNIVIILPDTGERYLSSGVFE